MYTENELVKIAKRENNNKRSYLVVNQLQGKHIPVSPKQAFQMFEELADIVGDKYPSEELLLIGFAETATAIGSALATRLNTYYIQTTRESIENVSYLYFSESHSHATEQKLVKDDIDKIIDKVDRIVFVEDEVTTGNTILNIIHAMEQEYSGKLKFAVASLLNGMNLEAEQKYQERQIPTHYLVKTNHDSYGEAAENYNGDGRYHEVSLTQESCTIPTFYPTGYVNARRLIKGSEYVAACENLWNQITFHESGKTLILGTEEFMFPALYIARKLEQMEVEVKCHSTTRSPIAVSSQTDYPLHDRYELRSFYDEQRITFIYDLKSYDNVVIITDADSESGVGLQSLIGALNKKGNLSISLIQWI